MIFFNYVIEQLHSITCLFNLMTVVAVNKKPKRSKGYKLFNHREGC